MRADDSAGQDAKAQSANMHVKIFGHVLQKVDGGYLVVVDSTGGGPGYALLSAAPLFLISAKDMVDGDPVEGEIYPIGEYSYVDTDGAKKTVRKFTDDLDSIKAPK